MGRPKNIYKGEITPKNFDKVWKVLYDFLKDKRFCFVTRASDPRFKETVTNEEVLCFIREVDQFLLDSPKRTISLPYGTVLTVTEKEAVFKGPGEFDFCRIRLRNEP